MADVASSAGQADDELAGDGWTDGRDCGERRSDPERGGWGQKKAKEKGARMGRVRCFRDVVRFESFRTKYDASAK